MPKQKYSSDYKVRFVLDGLKSPDGIATYCRSQGISETQFYTWHRQMLSNADALFARVPKSSSVLIQKLEDELRRKDHIIAVVTEEALDLKKKLVR